MAMEAVQTSQERLPTPAATAPMENNTSGGTPLATQKAPVQSIPRSRALGGSADWPVAAVGVLLVAMLLTFSPAWPTIRNAHAELLRFRKCHPRYRTGRW